MSMTMLKDSCDNAWRDDFPIFQESMNGKPVTYLDTASSAQKPQAVIDAMTDVLSKHYSNIHRGLYDFSQTNTHMYEAVRSKIANFIGAKSDNEIVFTRNTTEAINLVAESWGRANLKGGDEVIISGMEHHANIVPWQLLRDRINIEIKIIPVLDNGTLDTDAYETLLSDKTKLVSIVHISNALGTVNPVEQMTAKAKAFNPEIMTLVDGSQSAVHGPVNVQEIGCDFFCMTGHKLYGPNGVGALYGRYEVLNAMQPYQGGGDMIDTVTFEKTTFKDAPAKFEAGTPAIAEVIGFGAAIDYMQSIGMKNIAAHEKGLLDYAMTELSQIEGLTFYGTAQDKAGVISFTASWAHVSDIAMILDQCGVAIRTGHHCCMPLMQRFDVDATARVSFGLYSNKDDVDTLVEALIKAKEMLS